MAEYATLRELESCALQHRNDLLGEGKDIGAVATRVGKSLRPLDELDKVVAGATDSYRSSFALQEVPQLWRDIVGLYLPDENVDRWLNNRQAFGGSSARDKLSTLDPIRLSSCVDEVAGVLYEVLGFASVPAIPSKEQLLYVTRLAQAEQLQGR